METPSPPVSAVRQKVLAAFQQLNAGGGECSEVVLIKDRHFVGRRFRQGGFEAIWMADEGHISIFNEAGELIDTQPLEEAAGAAEEGGVIARSSTGKAREETSRFSPCSHDTPGRIAESAFAPPSASEAASSGRTIRLVKPINQFAVSTVTDAIISAAVT